jgi:hypothetical protein
MDENFSFTEQPKQEPVVYPVDATKATLEEMGILFNALGIAMTKEYADEKGLLHLLKIEE